MKSKSLIITHQDADGITSAIAYSSLFLGPKIPTLKLILKNFDIIDINYSENFQTLLSSRNIKLTNYNKVILLDFSFPTQIMQDLRNEFKENFIWIDHHKKNYQKIEKELNNIKINGLRDDSKAACLLVYKYFNKEPTNFARYISDMDLWTFLLPNSREFIAGLPSFETDFTTKQFEFVLYLMNDSKFNKKFKKIIKEGKIILKYQIDYIKSILGLGKIFIFEGYKTFIINTIFPAGQVSDSIFSEEKYKDIEIVIVWKKDYSTNKDAASLRSRTINITPIAEKYGGGGHPKASGVSLNNISELKLQEIE